VLRILQNTFAIGLLTAALDFGNLASLTLRGPGLGWLDVLGFGTGPVIMNNMTINALDILLAIVGLVVFSGSAGAQNECRFYLANQSGSNYGFTLALKAQADSHGVYALSAVNLDLSVGDGTNYHHVSLSAPPTWQTGGVYTAQAFVTAAGPQRLVLDIEHLGTNQVLVQGTNQALFQPTAGTLFGSLVDNDSPTGQLYLVSQISLQVSNGTNNMVVAPNGTNPIPLPSLLMLGPAPWQVAFAEDPTQTTTITASFRFDSLPQDTNQFNPYFDGYGQVTFSSWPGKVSSTNDFQAAGIEEQAWSATNGPVVGMDQYGGSTIAGWTNPATGFFTNVFHNNRWWLVSPLGNPLFYIGLTGIYDNVTPITGREFIFTNLPPIPEFLAAYSTNAWGETNNTTYVSFDVANQIRKYGSSWSDTEKTQAVKRILDWGFRGVGKEGGLTNLPRSPILKHDGGTNGVSNVVSNGHPDIFNSNIISQLTTSLSNQIGSDVTNPYILGWSVGNEKKEIIDASEVQAILLLGASVPAKQALVDYGLTWIYSNNLQQLVTNWGVANATNVQDVYAAQVVAPTTNVQLLRRYYEQSYYSNLHQIMKSIDANHLYFGSWILSGDAEDWDIAATNCDVVGIDDFSPSLTPDLTNRIRITGKPVFVGAFSFPSDYGGMRGFGWVNYTQSTTLSDFDSGDQYAQKLLSMAANPFFVGAEWFEYRDEPASGRGNTDGASYASGSLVVGENLAFGLVDITDRPKYGLVNKVRAANIAALESLGLLIPQIITNDVAFGVHSNTFGFHISGQPGQTIVVERSANLVQWHAFQTNTLGDSPLYFTDSSVQRSPQHYYRARYQ